MNDSDYAFFLKFKTFKPNLKIVVFRFNEILNKNPFFLLIQKSFCEFF